MGAKCKYLIWANSFFYNASSKAARYYKTIKLFKFCYKPNLTLLININCAMWSPNIKWETFEETRSIISISFGDNCIRELEIGQNSHWYLFIMQCEFCTLFNYLYVLKFAQKQNKNFMITFELNLKAIFCIKTIKYWHNYFSAIISYHKLKDNEKLYYLISEDNCSTFVCGS